MNIRRMSSPFSPNVAPPPIATARDVLRRNTLPRKSDRNHAVRNGCDLTSACPLLSER